MILTHFSKEGWVFNKNRPYLQTHFKPVGLWLSDESDPEYGWKEWCESNEFHLDHLKSATDFTISPTANIKHLATIDEVLEFNEKYKDPSYYPDHPYISSRLEWNRVAIEFDGILITPYETDWERRMPIWHSGWDVSSGCFWNLDAVVEVNTELEKEKEKALQELRDPKTWWDNEFQRLDQNHVTS